MKQLPPNQFQFGNYDSSLIPHKIYLAGTKEFVKWLETQNIIGYCKSIDVTIRPKSGTYCVMIEDDDWTGWSHIPDFVFNRYLEKQDV